MAKVSTVLLVDDDPELSDYLAEILRRACFEVVTASSMDQAVRCLGEQPFDVVVSDYNLSSHQTGADLLAWVAENFRDVGRVICSGALLPSTVAAHAIVEKSATGSLVKVVRALAKRPD